MNAWVVRHMLVKTLRRVHMQTKTIIWHADTTTVRLILAFASLLYALFFYLTPYSPIAAPITALMGRLFPRWIWITLFLIHGFGVLWRFADPVPRVHVALMINVLGFAIWSAYVALSVIGLGFMPAGSSLEAVMCAFSFWAICRTGLREEVASP